MSYKPTIPSNVWLILSFSLVLFLIPSVQADPPRLPTISPEQAGMNVDRLNHINSVVAEGLKREEMCGCVVLIGRSSGIVFEQAYGQRQILPTPEPMTIDTVFDLASLTKPIATGTSVMKLVEEGKIQVSDPLAKYIPEFGTNGKGLITIEQLLTHQAGLLPDTDIEEYQLGPRVAIQKALATSPTDPPGSEFIYSDVGPIVLAELVERITGENIHAYTQRVIFRPLGMTETGYLPDEALRKRAAATEQRENRWMKGEVHDPRAYLLGGIAGHAGLFSTAHDLAIYAQVFLGQGEYGGVRLLKPEIVQEMIRPREVPGGNYRSLGWDNRSSYSSNRGDLFSDHAFGHGGFTGTAMWIDPDLDLFVIFLSSRLHPDGKGNVNPLAGRIGTIAAAAIQPAP